MAPPKQNWTKNRRHLRDGFSDLAYLPRSPLVWDATLSAYAYAARQKIAGGANLNTWAVMNGVVPSGRAKDLGRDAVVLWHGTAAYKVPEIMKHGFRPVNKKAVYASLSPAISHGYTRFRSEEKEGGSAMFVLVMPERTMREEFNFTQGAKEIRLYGRVPPKYVEYILWSDRIEFVGKTTSPPAAPWPHFRFKKKDGKWRPLTKPPVRFEVDSTFVSKQEWVDLSLRRILTELGSAAAIEIFSSLYSTVEPWDALQHEEIFAAMERLCGDPRKKGGMKLFSIR
jgi:hypothetical protein